MSREKAETGGSRNFQEFCRDIGIDLGKGMSPEAFYTEVSRIFPEICEEIGIYPVSISQIGEFSDFKQVETRQFFGRQIGLIPLEGLLSAKTKDMEQYCQYPCLCCFDTLKLELLVAMGRVWQSKDPNVLLVHEGYGSVSGARDFINTPDFPREPLPVSDPKKICFHSGTKERTGTVLFAGKIILVLLGDNPGEKILESIGRIKCVRED
ncbi:MAG TPA: hypothetical protein P5080_01490 [Candidatus Paceibacterota bacterium]|nr:hypothetical protein [Candidatus Pacearchaeota archaeon]HRZ50738.1 hypothetical protein [Candidatus Paceibacterota bacterium]HSA36365.1 hypothetical protein [Candidatus Paceibacterota bacterium]